MQSPVRPGTVARREGLQFGVGLGILLALNYVISIYTNSGQFIIIVSLLSFAAYFWAGYRAGRVAGVTSAGLLAGLFTGVISSVVNLVIAIPFTLLNVDKLRVAAQKVADQNKNNHLHYTNNSYFAVVIASLLLGIVLAALFGIGLGAAGGAVGRARAPLPTQPYQESMYQGTQPPEQ
jgi:hypothetical protein